MLAKEEWNEKVKEALERTEFMALATHGEGGPWVCPVQFGYSDTFEIYFVSRLTSKHVRNIEKSGEVAAAIFKSERFPGPEGHVLGLQLHGKAKRLETQEEIEEAVRFYYTRGSNVSDFKNHLANHYGENVTWHFFKITPSELWCFDSRAFGEERQKIDLAHLSLPL